MLAVLGGTLRNSSGAEKPLRTRQAVGGATKPLRVGAQKTNFARLRHTQETESFGPVSIAKVNRTYRPLQ